MRNKDYFSNFYIRRALRIFPIFFGFWLLMLALSPVLHIAWNRYNVAMALYCGNFFIPGANRGLHLQPGILYYTSIWSEGHRRGLQIHHLWSLCVEEQFYLVWPLIVWLLRTRRKLLGFCLTVVAVLPVVRLFCTMRWPQLLPPGYLYFNTFTRVDALLVGAALALWMRPDSATPKRTSPQLRRLATLLVMGLPVLLGLLVAAQRSRLGPPQYDSAVNTIGFSLIAVTGVGLILLVIDPVSRLSRLLQMAPLAFLGRISYGMYFYHEILIEPVLRVVRNMDAHHLHIRPDLLDLLLTIAISWLSFRFIESPFLRLKPRLAPRQGAAEDPRPAG